jgi:CHAT domain-containing protein/tetratricopeptide (TPR) repeat protein
MRSPPWHLGLVLVLGILVPGSAPAEPAQKKSTREDPRIKRILTLLRQGDDLYRKGKLAEAIRKLEQAVTLTRQIVGAREPVTADVLEKLAALHQQARHYSRAEALLQESLRIRQARLGKKHLDVARSLHRLGKLYLAWGKPARAEPLIRRELAICEARLSPGHRRVLDCLHGLGLAIQEQGDYARAEPFYRRYLERTEARYGKEDVKVADCLNILGTLYAQNLARYAEAEALFRRGLRIQEARLGPNHPDVAVSLNNLAYVYDQLGQYARAEPLYQRSLKIREARLGPNHPDVAKSLNNLAMLRKALGQFDRAEPLFRRCLRIEETARGKDHLQVALALNNLAALYQDMEAPARALPLYRRSLEIEVTHHGPNHPDVANVLSNLGLVYAELARNADAEACYLRSLKIKEARLGKYHPSVATTLNNLGALHAARGELARAEPLLRRGLEIEETQLGPDHPLVIGLRTNLALLEASRKRWGEASAWFDRARRSVHRHIRGVLPALSEPEQLAFFRARHLLSFHAALSLGLARRDDPAVTVRSAGWVVNGKAVTQEALAERALLARDSADPGLRAIARDLLGCRNQLAALTFASPRPGQEAVRQRRLERLAARERVLAKQLTQAAGHSARAEPWVELDEVRRAIPADAVLIEIARVVPFRFGSKGREVQWQQPRYVAWVIPPAGKGAVQMTDLGEAEVIDAMVRAVRQTLQQAPAAIRREGEANCEQELHTHLETLAQRVLRPLAGPLGRARRWLVSPDGLLWLVPWEALPLPDGSYAIERHPISYLVSGRDLVGRPVKVRTAPPLVLADPDYDLEPVRARAEARRLGADQTFSQEVRSTALAGRLPRALRLPGTAAEARAIVPRLKAYAGAEPRLYTEKQALEGVFKAARRPRVVVLSTHGFFLEDQEARPPRRLSRGAAGGGWENPLLRCGLLLAGCNNRERLREATGEDGVLTGLEVVGCDLRGCELVVLSACETGLGQLQVGEGVAGLRQAFQLAGARAVVASLWQVRDRDTALLMSDFFAALAAGKDKAEALRAAQLTRIKARRSRYKAAHPFFWAAFTLTGG